MTSLPGWANRSVLELSRETGRIARAAEAETARLYRLPAETQVICRAVLSSIDVTPNEAVEIQGTLICQSAAHDLEDLDWRLLIEDRLTQVMGYTFFAFPPVGGAGTIHN